MDSRSVVLLNTLHLTSHFAAINEPEFIAIREPDVRAIGEPECISLCEPNIPAIRLSNKRGKTDGNAVLY